MPVLPIDGELSLKPQQSPVNGDGVAHQGREAPVPSGLAITQDSLHVNASPPSEQVSHLNQTDTSTFASKDKETLAELLDITKMDLSLQITLIGLLSLPFFSLVGFIIVMSITREARRRRFKPNCKMDVVREWSSRDYKKKYEEDLARFRSQVRGESINQTVEIA